jgi:Kef-type K+ transport system membrane component KefB
MLSLAATNPTAVHAVEHAVFSILLQIILILIIARLAGEVAKRLGQPTVIGEIIGGLLLGPSLFGRLSPDLFKATFQSITPMPMLILSQIGLVLLMFQIGLEFDFSHLKEKKNRRTVILISISSMICPFALGYLIAHYSAPLLAPDINQFAYKLFMATAFSITAIPTLGRILMEFGITRTRLGAIAITSAAINDIVGWLLLAAISALTMSNFSTETFTTNLIGIAAYFAVAWWVIRPLLHQAIKYFEVTGRSMSHHFMALMLTCIFISGLITYKLGIFVIFGGFIMGVLLFDQKDFVEIWKKRVAEFVTVFFLPIFFTYTGLRTNVNSLDSIPLWSWCAIILVGATLGKFGGCYIAARWAGVDSKEASCLGIMMNTRGLMELIILNVGYDLGVIPTSVFTMLVLMALVSTIIPSPILRFLLPKIGLSIPNRLDSLDESLAEMESTSKKRSESIGSH